MVGKGLVSVSCDTLLLRQVTRKLIEWLCVSGCVHPYCLDDDFMPNAVEFSASWEAEMQSPMRDLEKCPLISGREPVLRQTHDLDVE